MKIILEHTNNVSAKLIQFWMVVDAFVHGEKPTFTYNHALIEHNGIVWEAISPKVKEWSITEHYNQRKFRKGYKTIEFVLDLTDDEIELAISYLRSQVGKSYEYSNFILHPIRTFLNKWVGNSTDKQQYCYELALRMLKAINKYNRDIFINPREFLKAIKID